MAGLLWYRSYMDSLANTSGYYPDIHAGHADRVAELTLDAPYLVRETPAGYNQLELMELVGGTVAWNQLYAKHTSYVWQPDPYGITASIDSDGYLNVSGTAVSNGSLTVNVSPTIPANHVIMIMCDGYDGSFAWGRVGFTRYRNPTYINKHTSAFSGGVAVSFLAGDTYNFKVRFATFDLTAMFGPTIADYVLGLGTNDGTAWLQNYDYLKEDYYAYSAPALEHVKTTAHITKDSDNNVLGTYPFDSSLLLRGVPKLENGALIYDGDTYEPDGTVTRYFGIRAYQAGDESLADAITDGTDTVYKLGAPTTESADPYTAMQDVEEGGTEEFVTGNNVPVGNVSVYRRA